MAEVGQRRTPGRACGGAGVVRGCFAHYVIPTSLPAFSTFRHHVVERWRRARAAKSIGRHGPTCRD